MNQPASLPPSFQLSRMVASLWIPQVLHAVANLGVADAVGADGRASDAVARAIGADPAAVHRLLRAMGALELCTEAEDGRFALTPLGACLRADAPDSVRSWVMLMGGEMVWRCWGRLAECVRTGEPAPMLLEGKDAFEWIAAHPTEFAIFDHSMQELTRRAAPAIAAAYDFAGVGSVVDVGGGHGALLCRILQRHPHLRGVVFDQPHCASGAVALFAEGGVADRFRFTAGSFFEAVPADADVYLLKSVVHDWNDARSIDILRVCRAALRADARLVLVEVVVPARPGSSPLDQMIAGTDLNMLVMTGGRERTEAQYRALCAAVGLQVTRILPTATAFSLIEAAAA
ncbi:MAG TPA: methyltransferase [Candidatus Dormibacteraeota bacterium]|nr:methyltransferase [Candidatus Dormibacteraeota bacterium]